MLRVTISGTVVSNRAQNRPRFSEIQPNNKVPHSAPSARILPTHDASSVVIIREIGESLDCSCGSEGEAHPMDAPTLSAMMFAIK